MTVQIIFNSGIWATERGVNDDLKDLADELPKIVLRSRAESTVKEYSSAFNKWSAWAQQFNKRAIEPDPYDISMYLVHLKKTSNSVAPITKAIAAIAWAHRMAGVTDPTQASLVKSTSEGLKRLLAKPTERKQPVTSSLIKEIIDSQIKLDSELTSANLASLRTVTMCLLAYTGFLRFNELCNVRLGHLTFSDLCLKLLIPSSKTDVYRDGRYVVISATNSNYCPVQIMKKYISLAQIQSADSLLFRGLTKIGKGYKLRDMNQPLSYTRVRELVQDALRPLVGDVSKFGVHSFRAGGATAAAQAGVPDRLFKRHGRWKGEKAKDGYVKDNLSDLLSVSKAL